MGNSKTQILSISDNIRNVAMYANDKFIRKYTSARSGLIR